MFGEFFQVVRQTTLDFRLLWGEFRRNALRLLLPFCLGGFTA